MSRSPYYFDKAKAEAACDFFSRFLVFTKGEWAGKPFHLAPWQAHHTGQIFGWRRRKDGYRRYRRVRGWVPRKNGKGLALDTPLPTPSGWTTMGQIAVGDRLYDEAGRECSVTAVSDIHHIDCYEFEFSNGDRIVCDGDHRWLTNTRDDRTGSVRISRKIAATVDRNHSLMTEPSVQIVSVTPVPTVPTRCIQVDSPSHQFRCGRSMLPTHNSEWFAGIGHLLAIADGEPGAEVYSHALDLAQASVLFDMASRMVALSEPLSHVYEVTNTSLFCPALMATYRPLSGEAYGKHGLSPHAALGDEVHAWRHNRLHTFLHQGMGARRQPLDATISTAGEIKTYGYELFQESMAVLADPTLDPEMYVFNYAAEHTDDWTDPDVWKKANPNLGVSLKIEDLHAECRKAQRSPRLENDFKRYKLNLWVEQAKRWFPMRQWRDNTAQPDHADYWRGLPSLMHGRAGFVGIDLGSTSDITAMVWAFPPETAGGRVTLIARFWVPEDTVEERDSPQTPYKKWVKDGALLTTPGNVTDYDFIEKQIMEDCEQFQCSALAIDRWNATQVAVHLQEQGLPVVLFGQGFQSMGAPSQELERLFLSGQLEHGNQPVLEWMFGNATYRKGVAGSIKPDKEKAAEKIDGVTATVEALGVMNAAKAVIAIRSPWEDESFRLATPQRGLPNVAV